jgi:hypothetical protein
MFSGKGKGPVLRFGRAELTLLGEPVALEDDQVTVFAPEDIHRPPQSTDDPVIVGDRHAEALAQGGELGCGGRRGIVGHGGSEGNGLTIRALVPILAGT